MFINNLDPILFSIGPFDVRFYGLVYAIGFLITYLWLRHAVKTKRLALSDEVFDTYFLLLMISLIVFARIFEVLFFSPAYYIANPGQILAIWNGGLSFHGGLFGVILVTVIYARKYNISFYDFADLIVIPASFVLIFGRIANYINAEHFGKITNPDATPWCVVFQRVDEYCRHPSQLYESAKNAVIFTVLTIMHAQKKWRLKKGTLFWTFILLYGVLRFMINFWRDDPLIYGLSVGQWFCIGMIIVGTIFLMRIYSRKQ